MVCAFLLVDIVFDLISKFYHFNHYGLECSKVANNQLSSLPVSIVNCTRLNKLFVPNNALTFLPSELPTSIELLNASSNHISSFHPGLFSGLRKLMFIHFAHNEITDFPFDELVTLAGANSDGEVLQTNQSANLRVFDLIGNDGLNGLRAQEIAATQARLIQPWNFPRNSGHHTTFIPP